MPFSRRRPPIMIAAEIAVFAAGLTACAPYVYKADEYERDAKTFNKELTDREDVTICYNGFETSELHVAGMAETECSRFGRRTQPIEVTFGACPLFTPSEARFACPKVAAN